MNENNQNNSQEFKREAQETVNQVKDSFKNVNMKDETNKAKNFFTGIVKSPASTISGIAHDASNSFFKMGIVLTVVWVIVSVLSQIVAIVSKVISGIKYHVNILAFSDFVKIFLAVLSPIACIMVFALFAYLFHSKNNKKSFLTVVNTTVASLVPFVVSKVVLLILSVIGLIPIVGKVSAIGTPIAKILEVASVILLFFGFKGLCDENDENATKKFFIVEAIFFGIAFVLNLLSINIYLV